MSQFEYGNSGAEIYNALGITGTSVQATFEHIAKTCGDLRGLKVMDFGCGPGRSTRFLRSLGANNLIGVDRSWDMLEMAKRNDPSHKESYIWGDAVRGMNSWKFESEGFDVIVSTFTFIEMPSIESLYSAFTQLSTVLKNGGRLIFAVTNPDAYDHDYVTYGFEPLINRRPLRNGDPIRTIVKPNPELMIQDYYWDETIFHKILEFEEYKDWSITYPTPGEGPIDWLDENTEALTMIFEATK